MINRYLSIWEISHRWRDINPDKTDPADLPINVQDTIRYICRAVLNNDLPLYHQVVMTKDGKRNCSEIKYFDVTEFPKELEVSLYREYNKHILNSYFIEGERFFFYCVNDQCSGNNSFVDFPTCWSHLIDGSHPKEVVGEEQSTSQTQIQSLRPTQLDKLVCQAIAKTLWDIYPTMTIATMAAHSAILVHGGGKLYTGKNTLRDWLSEIAPKHVKKPGRPKTIKPTNDGT